MAGFITERIKEYENEYKENQKGTNSKKDKIENIRNIIFLIIGVINIIFAHQLRKKLPIIIGIVSVTISSVSLIRNIKQKEYTRLDTMRIPRDLVALILGIIILLKKENAIPFIAITWGISGLQRGCKGLNVVAYNKAHKKSFVLELIHSIFEIMIAILLIFNPFDHLEEHLILLGIEMIVSSLKICFKDKAYKNIED